MKTAIVLLLVLATVTGARADDRKAAERYFRGGERAYRAQNFEAAAANFEEAFKALPVAEIAFSAAQAYRRQYRVDGKASHVARAIELYRIYLAKVKTGGRVADAADALGEMQHELDQLIKSGVKVSAELAAEHTQLGVNVLFDNETGGTLREIEDAPMLATAPVKLTIDGTAIAPSTPMKVAPGTHAIHVEAEGFFPVDRSETVAQGAFQMIDVALEPRPAKLAITTEEGARISIDGRPAVTKIEVPAGKHLLAILRDGREPFAKELVVGRGAELVIDQPLVVTWRRRMATRAAIATGITAGLALATATFAEIEDTRASRLHDRFAGTGDQPPSIGADYDAELRWRDRSIAATWALGGATLAFGITAALLYYTDKPVLSGTF